MIKLIDQPKENFLEFLRDCHPAEYENIPPVIRVIINKPLVIEASSELFPIWQVYDEKCG